jgi:stearoyl-CoA desaturase (delta-9 desaturase)
MIAITLVILQMSVFCTTIYLHRTKTHKGLELNPVVGLLMHLELTLFTGVVPRQWAAVHRKHHHFSDEQGDPHSPYIYGMWTVLFGNYFMYRKEARDPQTIRKYTPDWKPDGMVGPRDRVYPAELFDQQHLSHGGLPEFRQQGHQSAIHRPGYRRRGTA